MQQNKHTTSLLPPEQYRAAVVKDTSIGVHHKPYLAAPVQGSTFITGLGEFQNLLVARAYGESFTFTSCYGQKCQHIEIVMEDNKIN